MKESDLLFEIYIDGNLDSNKTLANVSIVIEIYANFKYISKNIQKNLCNYILYNYLIFIIILNLFIFNLFDNSKKAIYVLSQF